MRNKCKNKKTEFLGVNLGVNNKKGIFKVPQTIKNNECPLEDLNF